MKQLTIFFMFLTFLSGIFCSAADKLAIAEPVGSGVAKDELKLLWDMLEANVGGGQYELITRGALQSMLTEIGLTDSSGLVDLSSAQKAKLGEIKTVKYILISNLNKAGGRYTLSLMVLDASTGEIRADQKVSDTVNSLADLTDKLKDILRGIGIGPAIKDYGKSAVLAPVISVKDAPVYLPEELTANLEKFLIENGIKLQNLVTVAPILQKNGIGNLAAAEPALYARVGDLLKVDYLVQLYVTRFSIRIEKKEIEVTQRTVTRHLGDINGSIRIISAQTGELVQSATFSQKVDFDEIDDDTDDWEAEDFGRYLIKAALPGVCKKVVSQFKK